MFAIADFARINYNWLECAKDNVNNFNAHHIWPSEVQYHLQISAVKSRTCICKVKNSGIIKSKLIIHIKRISCGRRSDAWPYGLSPPFAQWWWVDSIHSLRLIVVSIWMKCSILLNPNTSWKCNKTFWIAWPNTALSEYNGNRQSPHY